MQTGSRQCRSDAAAGGCYICLISNTARLKNSAQFSGGRGIFASLCEHHVAPQHALQELLSPADAARGAERERIVGQRRPPFAHRCRSCARRNSRNARIRVAKCNQMYNTGLLKVSGRSQDSVWRTSCAGSLRRSWPSRVRTIASWFHSRNDKKRSLADARRSDVVASIREIGDRISAVTVAGKGAAGKRSMSLTYKTRLHCFQLRA